MDTDPEAFIRWALDDARTLEERYTTELLVEHADQMWKHPAPDRAVSRV